MGQDEFEGLAHHFVGVEDTALMHIAVEVDAHDHGHVEYEQHGPREHLGRCSWCPQACREVHEIDNQQVDDAEYPSHELSVSAFTLHAARLDGISWLVNTQWGCITHAPLRHVLLMGW